MAFEDVLGQVMQWVTATEAMAALAAELELQLSDSPAPAEVAAALTRVSGAAGLTGLDELPPPQRMMLVGVIRMYLRQAIDLVDDPGRAPGWTYTDPAILDGWGRASMMVPPMIAASHPDLATVERVLDVGAGVGLLAVSAAGVWPGATIVGIDPWEASLDRARANVAQAGLGDRITLRAEDLAAIDDEDEFDCVWIPSFFLSEADLEKGLPAAVRALRPGGWIALATSRGAPDAIGDAVAALRVIRGGGVVLDTTRALELLAAAGCEDAHVAPPPPGPAPLDLVLGRKPV